MRFLGSEMVVVRDIWLVFSVNASQFLHGRIVGIHSKVHQRIFFMLIYDKGCGTFRQVFPLGITLSSCIASGLYGQEQSFVQVMAFCPLEGCMYGLHYLLACQTVAHSHEIIADDVSGP
jgi:hypothetical protein